MADQAFMYAILVSAFAILAVKLFSSRGKRKFEEKNSAAPLSTSGLERRGAVLKKLLIFFGKVNLNHFSPSEN
jgi:hypothetical protein